MTFGAEIWGPPLIQAAGSIASGYLSGKANDREESKMQKTKRKLVDQLLSSLNGQGPYSDLYNVDQDSFYKSFIEPAQSAFKNNIAPQIQQAYIASGQQRGTGLDDTLTRAGVDLDSMLNQYLYQAQSDAANRKQSGINSILGLGDGKTPNPTTGQNIMGGVGGYLGSQGFADSTANLFKNKTNEPRTPFARKGFEADAAYYNNAGWN